MKNGHFVKKNLYFPRNTYKSFEKEAFFHRLRDRDNHHKISPFHSQTKKRKNPG